MDCVFCSICRGQEDALILDETDKTLAFAPLDHISEGHMLVIPKEHYESLLDIPEPTLCTVMKHVRTISRRLCSSDFDGVNLLNASGRAAQQSVPHFHVISHPAEKATNWTSGPIVRTTKLKPTVSMKTFEVHSRRATSSSRPLVT